MSLSRLALPAASIAALLTATGAQADVTAQEVWDKMREMSSMYGEDVVSIGSVEADGGTVVVSDYQIRIEEDGDSVTAIISELRFVEQGDGTVLVTMSDANPLVISGPDVDATANIISEGTSVLVSGTPDNLAYEVSSDRTGVIFDPFEADGSRLETLTALATGFSGSYSVVEGDMRDVAFDVGLQDIQIDVRVTEADSNGRFELGGRIDSVQAQGTTTIPLDFQIDEDSTELPEGFAVDAGYSFGESAYNFTVLDDTDSATGTAGAESGALSLAISDERFSYSGAAVGPYLRMQASGLPVPIDISIASYGYDVSLPLVATDEPVNARFGLSIEELSINDEIWSMADPTAQLPRDPLTLNLDISTMVRLFFDLADAEDAGMSGDAPGEIHSATLNALRLMVAGAELTGEGAFTFDNDDLETFDGMPRPEGEVTLTLSGANRLIDTLVAMGMLPEDQAMGARMMLGLFAKPVGDDVLQSVIEVNPQGHLIANGQRLQ